MKKLLIIAAGLLFIVSACNSKKEDGDGGGMSERTKKNLKANQTVLDAFQSGDVSKIDSVVADDFVDHTDRGDWNRDSLKSMIKMMHGSGNDMKFELKKELADDDYVMAWYLFSGTSDGSMGMPAGPYSMNSIEVSRYNQDSKIVEHWGFMEMRDAMKMMQGGMPKDTSAHK
jgi:predicted ester cyclase